MFLLVGCASLVLYTATTDAVVRTLTLAEEAEERWLGVWRSLWPLVWLLGTLPLIVVDYAIQSSPVVMPRTGRRGASACSRSGCARASAPMRAGSSTGTVTTARRSC